jgi:hypothetical protein
MTKQSELKNNTEALSLEERKEEVLKEVRLELSVAKTEVIEGLSNGSEFSKKERDDLRDEILGQQESKVDVLKEFTPIEKEQLNQEIEKLFQEMIEAAEIIGYQASKLGTIRVFLETKLDDIEDPNSWGNWGKNKLASIKDFFGVSDEKEAMEKEKSFITQFLENDIEDVAERVMNGEKLEDILSNESDLKDLLSQNNINLKVPSNRAELLREKVGLVTHLRENSQYEAAQEVMENALARHFENARANFEKNNPAEVAKIEKKAEQRVEEMMKEKSSHTSWVNPQKRLEDMGAKPMTESEMKESREDLIKAEKRKMMNKEAGKLMKENEGTINFTPEERVIWGMYDDMLDPGDSLWNVSDATQDQILEELVINAPLIIVSGGVASLARAGITAGARAIAGRMAVKWAGKTFARKAAFWAAGMVVEGASFEASHIALGKMTGLNEEDLSAISGLEWAERIFWSSATLGAFHGTGKGVQRMFQKEVTTVGGKVMSKTSLTKGIEKITHPGLQKTMLKLVQGGTAVNLEAATMLLTGAAQHGYYSGDWEEYMENFGENVGHAYMSVLALKTSGKIIHPVMKPMMKLNQKLATNGENIAPLQKLTTEQIRKSELSQADRQKEAGEFLIQKGLRTDSLTDAQGAVLQKAHEYSEGGSMGNYSFAELKVKMEMLTKDGVFTSKEAKALMSKEGSFAGISNETNISPENTQKIKSDKQWFKENKVKTERMVSNVNKGELRKSGKVLEYYTEEGDLIGEVRYYPKTKTVSYEINKSVEGTDGKLQQVFFGKGLIKNIFLDSVSKLRAEGLEIKYFSADWMPGGTGKTTTNLDAYYNALKETNGDKSAAALRTPSGISFERAFGKPKSVEVNDQAFNNNGIQVLFEMSDGVSPTSKELMSVEGRSIGREKEIKRPVARNWRELKNIRNKYENWADFFESKDWKGNIENQEIYIQQKIKTNEIRDIANLEKYIDKSIWNNTRREKILHDFFEKETQYLEKFVKNDLSFKKELCANGKFKGIDLDALELKAHDKKVSSEERKNAIQTLRDAITFSETASGNIANLFLKSFRYCEENNLPRGDYQKTIYGKKALEIYNNMPKQTHEYASRALDSFEKQFRKNEENQKGKTKEEIFTMLAGVEPLSEGFEMTDGLFGPTFLLGENNFKLAHKNCLNDSDVNRIDGFVHYTDRENGTPLIVSRKDNEYVMNTVLTNHHEEGHALHKYFHDRIGFPNKKGVLFNAIPTRKHFCERINTELRKGVFERNLNLAFDELIQYRRDGGSKQRTVELLQINDKNQEYDYMRYSKEFYISDLNALHFTKKEKGMFIEKYNELEKQYNKIIKNMADIVFRSGVQFGQINNIPVQDLWRYSNGKYNRLDFILKPVSIDISKFKYNYPANLEVGKTVEYRTKRGDNETGIITKMDEFGAVTLKTSRKKWRRDDFIEEIIQLTNPNMKIKPMEEDKVTKM